MTIQFRDANKILFLNPPASSKKKFIRNFDCATESKGNYLYQPYSLLLLTSSVPSHWKIEVIDSVADKLSVNLTLQKIKNSSPQIVVTALAESNWNEDFAFFKQLKEQEPETLFFVFGDSFIEKESRTTIKPFVSAIIENPFEFNFSKFFDEKDYEQGVYTTDKNYSNKKPREVRFQTPRHDLFKHTSYRWPFTEHLSYTTIFLAWGCPYSCSYCVMAKFPNIYRTGENVLEELIHIKSLGYKEFYMGDRSFGLPMKEVTVLLKQMIETELNLKWSTYFHPNQYTPELLELMAKSGCHTLIIGIESSNIKSLKKFNRNIRSDDFEKLLIHSEKLGIKICGDFILGLPGENKEQILETIKYSTKLKLDYASFNIAAPLPGSSIKELAIKNKLMGKYEKGFDSLGNNKPLGNELINGEELIKLRNYAIRCFYLRPSYLFRRFLKIRTFEQLIIQLQEAFALFSKTIFKEKS